MQVWLAACHNERQTHETGVGEKENSLFKCQTPDMMGDSCPKAHLLSISVQTKVFIRRGGKAEQRNQGKVAVGVQAVFFLVLIPIFNVSLSVF